MTEKKCTKCGEIKPITAFAAQKAGKNGLKASCRECERERLRAFALNHPDKIKASGEKWRSANPEKLKEVRKAAREKWAMENLQPLWAEDNLKKHAKLDRSFQPSLAIAINY